MSPRRRTTGSKRHWVNLPEEAALRQETWTHQKKTSWLPCGMCGVKDGRISGTRNVTPLRLTAARLGWKGDRVCQDCYDRLYRRWKRVNVERMKILEKMNYKTLARKIIENGSPLYFRRVEYAEDEWKRVRRSRV